MNTKFSGVPSIKYLVLSFVLLLIGHYFPFKELIIIISLKIIILMVNYPLPPYVKNMSSFTQTKLGIMYEKRNNLLVKRDVAALTVRNITVFVLSSGRG